MGVDFIEGDLVVTRDGSLVVRHDAELSTTTDVASHPEFSQRRTTKRLDGSTITGWFVEDFTLAEIKMLRATMRQAAGTSWNPGSSSAGQDRHSPPPAEETVPTITEVINLARAAGAERGREVGLYFELKSPSYFRSIGLAPEPMLIAALQASRLTTKDAKVFVESFESESLRLLRQSVSVPMIQLLWGSGQPNDADTKPEALRAIAQYAAGIGVARARLRVPGTPETATNGVNRALITAIHQAGLELHVYTFEDKGTRSETLTSYQAYYTAQVDAVFTDKPDLAISMRN
jgi:glycerophosphoryl diester phosphodiesterase